MKTMIQVLHLPRLISVIYVLGLVWGNIYFLGELYYSCGIIGLILCFLL